jgi:hypothetical protein
METLRKAGDWSAGGAQFTIAFTIAARAARRDGARQASVTGLVLLGVAEYLFFGGDVMGQLHVSDGLADLILGSQWAAVVIGASYAPRTLVTLIGRSLASRNATGGGAPPDNAGLAPG